MAEEYDLDESWPAEAQLFYLNMIEKLRETVGERLLVGTSAKDVLAALKAAVARTESECPPD